jgi:hypothetical protein
VRCVWLLTSGNHDDLPLTFIDQEPFEANFWFLFLSKPTSSCTMATQTSFSLLWGLTSKSFARKLTHRHRNASALCFPSALPSFSCIPTVAPIFKKQPSKSVDFTSRPVTRAQVSSAFWIPQLDDASWPIFVRCVLSDVVILPPFFASLGGSTMSQTMTNAHRSFDVLAESFQCTAFVRAGQELKGFLCSSAGPS